MVGTVTVPGSRVLSPGAPLSTPGMATDFGNGDLVVLPSLSRSTSIKSSSSSTPLRKTTRATVKVREKMTRVMTTAALPASAACLAMNMNWNARYAVESSMYAALDGTFANGKMVL